MRIANAQISEQSDESLRIPANRNSGYREWRDQTVQVVLGIRCLHVAKRVIFLNLH